MGGLRLQAVDEVVSGTHLCCARFSPIRECALSSLGPKGGRKAPVREGHRGPGLSGSYRARGSAARRFPPRTSMRMRE